MTKRQRDAPAPAVLAAFPRLIKRVREACGGEADRAVISFLRTLLEKLGPQWMEEQEKPSEAASEALRVAIGEGCFGRRQAILKLLRKHPKLPIHSDLLQVFQEIPSISAEEERCFVALEERMLARGLHYPQRETVLRALNALRALVQRSPAPAPAVATLAQTCDLQTASRFCVVNGQLAESRLQLLFVVGFNSAEEQHVRATARRLVEEEALVRKICEEAETDCSVTLYWQLLRHLSTDSLQDALRQKSPEELLQHIRAAGFGKRKAQIERLVTAFAKHCGLHSQQETLASLVHERRLSHGERFAGLSAWHREVFNHALDYERNNYLSRATFPDKHQREFASKLGCFLWQLHRFAGGLAAGLPQFIQTADLDAWHRILNGIVQTHRVRNERVKSTWDYHYAKAHAYRAVQMVSRHLHKYVAPYCDVTRLSVRQVLEGLANRRVCASPLQRRTFTETEVQSMLAVARGPAELVLLTLLREVALRLSALGNLKYSHLLDEHHVPRSVCAVPEKNRKMRTFVASANLQTHVKALSDFLRNRSATDADHLSDTYVLNVAHPSQPLSGATIDQKLRRIANDAGVRDVVVHAHAFRHTLVTSLVKVGNRLSDVAKFMGHADSVTTNNFYWIPSAEDLHANLIDPFKPEYHEEKMQREAASWTLQACQARATAYRDLLHLFLSCSDADTLRRVSEKKPQWRDLLQHLDEFQTDEDANTSPPGEV